MVFRLVLPVLFASVGLASIGTSGTEAASEGVAVFDEARRLAEAGRGGEAVALLEERAHRWFEAGRLADAGAALALAVELTSDDATLRLQLGRVLMLEKRQAAALEHLERAAELGMQDPVLLFHLGSARWENGEIEAAASALEAAVEASYQMRLAPSSAPRSFWATLARSFATSSETRRSRRPGLSLPGSKKTARKRSS